MCHSKANGGHRCPDSPTRAARRRLQRQVRRAHSRSDATAADQATAALTHLDAARARYGDMVTPLNIPMPDAVEQVFTVIRDAGYRPLVVGGSVRDALTDGRTPKDIDVEVYGASIDEVTTALAAHYRVDEVGKAFGVLKVTLLDGTDLDVSVPRRDNQVGAGHRGFEVELDRTMTVSDAASRRDYTLNSMGYDPEHGVCVDPYDGRTDLTNRVLRHTGPAFAEDPLRVLRGFQFAARYDMTLHPDTAQLCRSLVGRAGELPAERIRGEWAKFYAKGTHPARGLEVLADSGWDTTVTGLPAVNTPTVRAHVDAAARLATRDRLDPAARTRLLAATLIRTAHPDQARAFIKATVERDDQQAATRGLAHATAPSRGDDTTVRTWARELGATRTSIREWSRLATATGDTSRAHTLLAAAERLGCADHPQPDLIQGRDILQRRPDRTPGPWVGDTVRHARAAQDQGAFTDAATAARWLDTHLTHHRD